MKDDRKNGVGEWIDGDLVSFFDLLAQYDYEDSRKANTEGQPVEDNREAGA